MANKWNTQIVSKYIRKSNTKNCIGYTVFIHRHDLQVNERFETLEKAIAFRDECLRMCEARRIQKARDQVLEEYPQNLIVKLGWDIELVYDNFETRLQEMRDTNYLNEREYDYLLQLYKDQLTLEEIGSKNFLSRERVRQIVAKAIRKLQYRHKYFMFGKLTQPYEEALKEFEQIKNDLISRWTYEEAQKIVDDYWKDRKEEGMKIYDSDEVLELDLSVRACNCLRRVGIDTVGKLKELNPKKLLKIKNMGKKCQKEILNKMQEFGIEFYNK